MNVIEKARKIKEYEATAKKLKIAADELKDTMSQLSGDMSKLKDEIIQHMEENNLTNIKEDGVSITCSDAPFSVVIDNEDLVPPEFVKEKVVKSIDKKALIEQRDSIEIDGIEFIQTKKLTIKA